MHPIIFDFGPLTVYSYGLMVALGFIIATLLAAREAEGFNIPKDKVINLSLVILISGIVGARLFYVLINIKEYLSDPLEMVMVTHGGLVFYGGAIFAFFSGLVYVKMSRLSVLDVADLISPYAALGHSIGRIGCFLNGCCFGRPTLSPLGVAFQDGIVRIPTQIYSSVYLLFLYIFLRVCLRYRRFGGEVFFLYLIFYSTGRIFIEYLRGDNAIFIYGLTFSQLISLGVFLAGVSGYFLKRGER
jgi:phosphatidylglycerol---prolipoprotein diacylglyceryl transferase